MADRSRWRRWTHSRAPVSLGIGLAVFVAVLGAREAGWLVSWELGAYDNYLRLREPTTRESPVTLVYIHEDDYARFGHPLPDHVLADGLARLGALQPRALGVDVYRDRPVGEGWDELRDVFILHPQVVIVEKLEDAELPAVPAPTFLPDRRQVGFADVATDTDAIVRRGLLYLWGEDGTAFLSFPLKLASLYLYFEGVTVSEDPEIPGVSRFGETSVLPFDADFGGYKGADDGGYQYLLDYRRPVQSIPSLRFSDVIDGDFDPGLVTQRVVLVGTAAPSVKDFFFTPTGFFDSKDQRVFGVALHALAIDQLIRYGRGEAQPMTAFGERVESAWVLLWCLLGALAGLRALSALRLLGAVAVGLLVLLGGGLVAFQRDLWLPVVPAAMGGLGALALVVGYITQQERADRAKAMNLFGRYVSRSLVDEVWKERDLFMEGDRPRSQRIQVTVLLSDLLGYTTRSEKSDPSEVMEWLGTYTDRMAQLVEQHGGMVNDFLGDGLMASFGVPVPSTSDEEVARDAVRAVECAVAMGEALDELNDAWRSEGKPTARLRIGIFTGPAVVGHIGARDRMKYATVGNTVNTAARLETYDKIGFENEETTTRILIGQPTLDCLGDGYQTTCLGDHVLKGKGEAVTIYRVHGRAELAAAAQPRAPQRG